MKQNKMREEMTNKFIEGLKQDDIPWQRNWSTLGTRPVNATKGTAYHGVNSFWLSFVAEDKGYKDPRWCTFNQAKDKGWKINRGEKGTRVEFWSLYDTETKKKIKPDEAEKLKESLGLEKYKERVKPLASVYSVFNAEQMTGVPEIHIEKHKWDAYEIMEKRDLLLKNMNLGFQEKEERAFYRPSEDKVHMPDPERFTDGYAYFSTFLHEAGHATGHESRLDRKVSNGYGTPEYAREELRAEIASAFTAQSLGLDSSKQEYMENHKAYIQSWIKALEENPSELFSAIKDAEKISDYLIEKGELERVQMREEEVDMKPEMHYEISLTSDAMEDAYYISAVDSNTGEEITPYRDNSGDMPTFASVDDAVSYCNKNDMDYMNPKEVDQWHNIEVEKANDIDHQLDSIKHVSEGIVYYDSAVIEKEIPENMRLKEANTTLQNDGGMYWVTQESFTMADLEQFQKAMIKYDIPKAYITVRDLSWGYNFTEDMQHQNLVEVTQDTIDCRAFNKTCKEMGDNWACIYPEVKQNEKDKSREQNQDLIFGQHEKATQELIFGKDAVIKDSGKQRQQAMEMER